MAPSNHSSASRCRRPRMGLAFSACALFLALSSGVLAQDGILPPEITPPASLDAAAAELVVDTRIPTWTEKAALPQLLEEGQELRRRQKDDEDDKKTSSDSDDTKTKGDDDKATKTKSDKSTKATKTVSESASGPLTTVSETATSTAPAENSPLPSAFDMTPSSDFKSEGEDDSCPSFVSNLLASSTYKDCYPLSMMMQTSTGLFQAEKQLTSIVRVLDATCAADVDSCSDFLSQAASNLTTEANCKAEYDAGLNNVVQVYQGLRAYEMLYSASCLQNPDTDMYCFATAVTNTTEPSDFSLYFMPLGWSLPGGSTPSCGLCTEETMGIFHSASSDRSQAIADVYEDSAQVVSTVCGPDAVNVTLAEEVSAAGPGFMPTSAVMVASVFATILLNSML